MILKFICGVKKCQESWEKSDKGEFVLLDFEFIGQIEKLENTHR